MELLSERNEEKRVRDAGQDESSGVYICKSVVNDLRHGNYICKSEGIHLFERYEEKRVRDNHNAAVTEGINEEHSTKPRAEELAVFTKGFSDCSTDRCRAKRTVHY